MNFSKSFYMTILLFVLSVIVLFMGNVIGIIDESVANAISALFGFGGVASLRSFIKSKGWKTYFLSASVIVLSILTITNIIPKEFFDKSILFILSLSGIALTQAAKKQE